MMKFVFCISVCQLAGLVGSLFTFPAIPEWYAMLRKPAFSPPNWVFGPVWVTLYFLMGISLFIVWNQGFGQQRVKMGMILFFIQLMLNTVWSVLFFGMHSPKAGFIEICLLWLAIVATLVVFYKISKVAAGLLIPYLLWVSFAVFLNYSIASLN